MPWKNNNGDVSDSRPTRVRLPESDTRTAEAVTDEVLEEAGWYWEEPVVIVTEVTADYTESFTATDSFTITESFTVSDSSGEFNG